MLPGKAAIARAHSHGVKFSFASRHQYLALKLLCVMAKPSVETHGQPFAVPFQEGKFQPQKTPVKVSYSFYLSSADDTYLLFAPRSVSGCIQQFALDRDIFISFLIHRSQITEIGAPQLRCSRHH